MFLLVNLKVKFFVIKVFICIISHFFFCFPAFIYSSNCLSEKICVKDLANFNTCNPVEIILN